MKSDRPYPFVTIDARGAKRAQQGHPWVFDNEITAQEGALEDGALCDVRSPKGRYLGTGTYNSHSKIRVRLLSQNANDRFDQAFFRPAGPVRLGLPQDRHGTGRGQLPRHLWRGGPLPRPDRGQVWGHPGHPDVVPGHRAAQGLDLPRPGTGHRGRRRAYPGHL